MIKILVVDDEPDTKSLFLQRFRKKIRGGEWAFDFCYDGEEALKALRDKDDIDVVLSDINMPKMDGLALLEKIKSQHVGIETIIISAYGDMKNIRTAMNRGAFDFITKPINFEDLDLTLSKTIQRAQTLKQALQDQDKLFSLNKELEVAKKIQLSILPSPASPSSKCDIFAQMIPAREVGGDYYDFFLIDKNHIGLVIADVSGKGISSALFAVVNQTLLKSSAPHTLSPKKCLQSVNTVCSKNNDNCMFATVFYGVLNLTTGQMAYSNAGHNPPYKITPAGKAQALPATGDLPIGASEEAEFNEKVIQLKPEERLALYTDGVTEANNTRQEEFGEQRLRGALAKNSSQPVQKAGKNILQSVQNFAGEARQYDDITFVLLKYKN